MPEPLIYSIIESPSHPNFSSLYSHLGFNEVRFSTQRKAIAALKSQPASLIVAEFFYGFGSNYAGVNVSNLDVLLMTLRRYSPAAQVIALAQKEQLPHIAKLEALFTLYNVLPLPCGEATMTQLLEHYTTKP